MLPLSRNRTYGPGVKVHSADIDDIQDCIIGGKRGVQTLHISPVRWEGEPAAGVVNKAISSATWPVGGGGSSVLLGPELPIGAVVTEVRVRVRAIGDNVVRVRWSSSTDAGVATTHAQDDTTTPGAWEVITLTGPFPAIATGVNYAVFAAKQSGAFEADTFGRVEIDWYLP